MVVLLSLFGLGLVATGVAAMVFGAPIVQVERGWTMVISGTVCASAGAVLLGVSLATQRLGRIAREIVQVRDCLGRMEELSAIRTEVQSRSGAPAVSVDRPSPPPSPPGAPITIVGQYASGGNSYVMYSDGSIRAELPGGPRRFSSIEDLRAFIATGED